MSVERSFGSAVGVAAVAGLFAGCGSGSQSSGLTPTMSQEAAIAQRAPGFGAFNTLTSNVAAKAGHPSLGGSWPAIRSGGARFFVSDLGGNVVTFYGYESLKHLGSIGPKGLNEPQGMCNDKKTIWLANSGEMNVIHYSASGKVLATLADAGQTPVGCALDEQGDLAVSNIGIGGDRPGSVSIWKNATGNPTNFALPGGAQAYFVAYDPQGNVFVDSLTVHGVKSGAFSLFELVKGASTFTPIRVAGATINYPGGLQYADNALAIGDQSGSPGYSVIYQTHISGSTATVVGTTDLDYATDAVQTCITPFGTIIVPDAGDGNVQIYRYPAGGTPIDTVVGFDVPVGSALIP
jgi:hypothetical protein